MPDFEINPGKAFVKLNYDMNYIESKRKNLAMQEHCRWNAYMIARGFVPATKEQIMNEKTATGEYTNGKNFKSRHHGNLTSFDGLIEFRRMIASREKDEEIKHDVIKYDYQLLDGAWWLLDRTGYFIIQKNKTKNLTDI